jgi:MFS family permease
MSADPNNSDAGQTTVITAEPSDERLRKRNLRLWLFSVSFSLFGDTMLWLVAGLWVKTVTGSDGAAGLTFMVYLAPGMFAPALALVVDRVRRKRFLIMINLTLPPVVCLALLVHTSSDVWLLFLVLLATGFGSSLHAAAGSAMLPRIVGAEGLGRANALLRTIKEIGLLVAPIVGTALFATVGPWLVVLIDAATFLVAVVCIALVRVPDPVPVREAGVPLWSQLTAGVRHVWGCLPLRQTVVTLIGVLAVFGMIKPVLFALVGTGLQLPVTYVGVLTTCQAVGAILGGVLSLRIVDRLGPRRLLFVGLMLFSAGYASLLIPHPVGAAAGFVIIGCGIPPVIVGLYTQVQRLTPDHLLGRATTVADSLISLPQTAFMAVGAALVADVDHRVLLAVMTATVLVSALYYGSRLRTTPAAGV